MTHSKQLCSKLISLLLALAMILALMPAVSLTASAAGPKYVLTANTPKFSSDGWTWDGQTLHFFGSGTYEVNSDYFSIESTKNGGDAVIDISGSITVSFTKHTAYFIDSPSCPLNIKGAGKITASTDTNSNKLFVSGCNITYAGGAICTDSDIALFISYPNDFTMTNGYIDAPNAYIEARSHTIRNSYVAINSFNGSDKNGVVINIDKSYVDTQSILETDKERGLSITLNNSVLRSAAERSELELADNDIKKPQFSKVTNSVVYLTKVGSVDGLTLSTALTSKVQKAVDGGYVFCNQLITDKDLSGGNLDGKVNTKFAQLSGAFYKSTTNTHMSVSNVTLTGGVLLSAPFDPNISNNAIATDATIVLLSEKDDPVMYVQKATDCTIVAINESASSNEITLQICEYVDKCNVYSTATDGIIHAIYSNPNSYYFPKGRVKVYDDIYDPDVSWFEGEGNITAESLEISKNSCLNKYIIRGNYCADSFKTDEDFTFDGSAKYSVNLNSFTGSGKLSLDGTAAFTCEKDVDTTWAPADFTSGYSGGSNTQLYIGRQVFNTLAADEATKTYDALTLSKGSSVTINVPLTLPFEQWVFRHEILLFDEQNKPCNLDSVGITADFADGGKNSLNIVLKAGSDVAAGSYKLGYAMNGQGINKGQFIPLTLTEYPFHTMEFGDDSSISWPYIDKDGNPKTFTGADYEKKIEADTWTWYGRSDQENGYGGSTLVLNDGFNFTTTADYGISKTKQTTFNIVVNGSCTVNAAVAAIHSEQNIVNINGADDNSTLSVNTGIVSDEKLYISGVDIEANNVTSVIKAPAQLKPLLQSAEETFLYDCKITANDRWEDEEVIHASGELKITRGVTLDLPASTIWGGQTYIAELESVDNILNGLIGSAALTVEGSPYGEYSGVSSLKWKDAGFGMKLSTKPLEFIGTASGLIIADDTISADGDYCLFSGKEYRLDLSKLINVDISDCQIMKDTTSGYSVKSQLVDGTQYFIVIPGKKATGSTTNSTVTIIDSNSFYGSSMSLKLDVTLGRVVKADRIGFYCQGNYDTNKQCYIPSATYKGNPLELKKDGYNYYYLVPSGEEIEITLIPADGYRFDSVSLGEWKYDGGVLENYGLSPSGTYTVTTKGADVQLLMDINKTTVQQYYKVDIADSLRQDVADGKIKSVTLTYSDGSVKVEDGTTVDDFPTYATKDKPVTVSIAVPTDSSGDPLIIVKKVNGVNANYNSDEQKYISGYFRVNKDTVITAEYEIPATSATVTVNCSEHGTVTPATAEYPIGTSVTLTVTPDEGYRVKSAQLDGNAVTLTNGTYTFTVTADCVFTAEFEEIPAGSATVTVNCGEHGTVTPATADYAIGTSVTLTVTPDSGYRVKSAALDGKDVKLTDGKYTFTLTADCVFSAEFEEIPADSATVTVKCGANGTVTPSTSDYPIGTEVTLTVTPAKGYQVKSAALDGKDVKLTDGKYTFTLTADCVFSVEFQKKPTGGSSSGGHSYTGSGSTGNRESVPALNGESRSWNEISSDLSKMDENSRADVYMNGSTSIPSAVLKEIKDKKISVVFRFDSNKSWTVDGSMITSDYASADLYLLPGTSTEKGARGSAGYRFSTGGNDVGAVLNIQFKNEYVGKFANLYFIKDGKAEFAGTSRVDENGYAAMPGASAKGEYVVMLCDYSDLPGDVSNDGVLNALDASAILNDIIGNTKCANALMGDFNIDGHISAKDASAILIHIVS